MKRSKRLLSIIKIAERAEQESAKRLAASRQTLNQYQQQLKMLDMYLDDYFQKLSKIKAQGQLLNHQTLKTYQDFILTIEQGIKRQNQLVSDAQTVIKQQEQQWREAHAKVESFKHLQQKFKNEEDRELDRQEQRMIDDYVSRPR
ncbi:flagellar export protein FliJ [Piscirickettsia litoralis]|uniref:Flagellar FliJ protein n=1 Tax=Piscirickettsia litoralis TaxID=1891921 RepID=A0ABX3A1E7_9GAMM|nr:flagellar export protein FliJ [Piscirickettsia litoralis]ODN42692.1 flagellar export protein FliJ [Piscirickettsia litoralis]